MEKKALNSEIKIEEINLKKEKLAEIDNAIKEAKEKIEFAEAIKELQQHPAFIKVIEEGYMEGEGKRISECLLSPTLLRKDQIETMVEMMNGIRFLKTFIKYKFDDGIIAAGSIDELEALRIQVNSEEN